ncbi:hypothetical protein H1164_17905 [Thermoactinomyces daqus]|uniref:Uncharacterized protein n=1 Tax=Thermoactinomyces daqus TaxID=1329516 RepID=A0A7W1XDS6_9BACL|nr:hypothetical protein [Thermoactinomyces daqus]MBA4544688.1 hypothetical protein [Thermoactinomyces daqus]
MGDRYQMEFEWESSIFKGRMEKGFVWLEADDDEDDWKRLRRKFGNIRVVARGSMI